MTRVFAWVAVTALFLAMVFGGALSSGEEVRANWNFEQPDERTWRVKAALAFLAVAIVAGFLAWAFSGHV